MDPASIGTPLLWAGFFLFMLAILGISIAVSLRRTRAPLPLPQGAS